MRAQVYTALISACSQEILRTPSSNRRLQLVLLERAQGVLAEVRARSGSCHWMEFSCALALCGEPVAHCGAMSSEQRSHYAG